MHVRPIGPLVDSLRQLGLDICYRGREGCLPLSVHLSPQGKHPSTPVYVGKTIHIDGSLSSQFVSGIVLATVGALNASSTLASTVIEVTSFGGKRGNPTSRQFIDLTLDCCRSFGFPPVEVDWKQGRIVFQNGQNTSWKQLSEGSGREFRIPGDATSASYPLAFAAITGNS